MKKRGHAKKIKLPVWLVPALLVVVLLGMSVLGSAEIIKTFTYNKTDLTDDLTELGIDPNFHLDVPEGITNIALFGIDDREASKPGEEGFRGLSDTIMILTIDSVHGNIKLTSVMRDSLVKVDGYGYQKINAAYNLGGPLLAIKTLNQTFRLNITDYVTVDFSGMASIIDYVGGVEAELTEAEVKNANQQIESMAWQRGTPNDKIKKPGKQTLNGIQAVGFARVRKVATINGTRDNAGRTERQQLVMRQLFQKALSTEISRYPLIIKALLPYMETSLTYDEVLGLAGILEVDRIELIESRMPTNEMLIVYGLNVTGLGSCWYYNLDYAADAMNALVFEDISFEDYIAQNGVDRTRWFPEELIAGNAAPEEEEGEEGEELIDPETDPTTPETPEEGGEVTDPGTPETPEPQDPAPETPAEPDPPQTE